MARKEEGKERSWIRSRETWSCSLELNARFHPLVREKKRSWGRGGEVVVEALRSRFEIAVKRRGSEWRVCRRQARGERKPASPVRLARRVNETREWGSRGLHRNQRPAGNWTMNWAGSSWFSSNEKGMDHSGSGEQGKRRKRDDRWVIVLYDRHANKNCIARDTSNEITQD